MRSTTANSTAALRLGLDLGSVNVHAVLVAAAGDVRRAVTVPVQGQTRAAVAHALEALATEAGTAALTVGVTGAGREMLNGLRGVRRVDDITAAAVGTRALVPRARSVIEIGGHFSKWLRLSADGDVEDYWLNEPCAAGSGAFLEQQAGRLRLTVAELGQLAATATSGVSVAGRCSVFAKSDMIHQQQKGTPTAEIAYGLCLALARSYAATVLKGRQPVWPAAVIGGAAANPGLVRALHDVLQASPGQLVVPEQHDLVAAVGGALAGADAESTWTVAALAQALVRGPGTHTRAAAVLAALRPPRTPPPVTWQTERVFVTDDAGGDAFLGIDVGSVSTDLALLDPAGRVLAGVYLPTRGAPLAVMEEALELLRPRLGDRVRVLGAATTGSGRHLAGQFLQADLVRNEITAQLTAAVHVFPEVETVFEIGGQDSKYIAVRAGAVSDFTMNKICAAGTGSFLEEQSARLGLDIIGEFATRALAGQAPVDLGSRCTVFMDTELVHALQRGVAVDDIAAGLAYSIAHNYLDKVVAGRVVGRRVVFQGGVASNAAVVAAFEQCLGAEVRVHPYNRYSGAIGAALLARQAYTEQPFASRFIGFATRTEYRLSSFECRHCANRCQVSRIERDGQTAFFGDVCERYTASVRNRRETAPRPVIADLWAEQERRRGDACNAPTAASAPAASETATAAALRRIRRRMHVSLGEAPAPPASSAGTVGIPRGSLYYELLPLWAGLFRNLGYRIVDSGPSTRDLLALGARRFALDTCLPVKLACSHAVALASPGPDWLFVPSVLDLPMLAGGDAALSHTCPCTQSLPYLVRTALKARLLTPQVSLARDNGGLPDGLEALCAPLGITRDRLRLAFAAGMAEYRRVRAAMTAAGAAALARVPDWAAVVIGKPYNLYDPYLNLNLDRHLRQLGVNAIPYDHLPDLDREGLDTDWDALPWRFNRDFIRAARRVQADPRLYPIVVSNFGCGPDGFTIKHMETILRGRPTLFLEFDEHRGEAGLVTRLEAFLDEIAVHRRARAGAAPGAPPRQTRPPPAAAPAPGARVFVPYFSDHAFAYAGALRHVGYDAEVLPLPDEAVVRKGEAVSSGKECHPFAIIAGDLVTVAERADAGRPAAFFFPGTSIPCLLTQYGPACRLILERLGRDRLQVLTPDSRGFFDLLGLTGGVRLWRGLFATDLLVRMACELRAYETKPGAVDAIHDANCRAIQDAVADGDIATAAEAALARLAAAPVDRDAWAGRVRPVIGVAGDLYTRANRAANQDLFHTLEGMGCEVWPAPFVIDVFDYSLRIKLARGWRRRDVQQVLRQGSLVALKEFSEQDLRRLFRERFRHWAEPDFDEVRRIAAPYVGEHVSEVLVVNIAKMADFARRGADGVINAMCLNCLVGMVSAALLGRVRADYDGIPLVNLAFGAGDAAEQTLRIEAFVEQARQFARRRPAPAAGDCLESAPLRAAP